MKNLRMNVSFDIEAQPWLLLVDLEEINLWKYLQFLNSTLPLVLGSDPDCLWAVVGVTTARLCRVRV